MKRSYFLRIFLVIIALTIFSTYSLNSKFTQVEVSHLDKEPGSQIPDQTSDTNPDVVATLLTDDQNDGRHTQTRQKSGGKNQMQLKLEQALEQRAQDRNNKNNNNQNEMLNDISDKGSLPELPVSFEQLNAEAHNKEIQDMIFKEEDTHYEDINKDKVEMDEDERREEEIRKLEEERQKRAEEKERQKQYRRDKEEYDRIIAVEKERNRWREQAGRPTKPLTEFTTTSNGFRTYSKRPTRDKGTPDNIKIIEKLYEHGGKNITFDLVDQDDEKSSQLGHNKVFLYSLPRSGSSFIGQFYKHTEGVVYLFEPFHSFKVQESCGESVAALNNKFHIGDVMSEIYTCDFQNMVELQTVKGWLNVSSTTTDMQACRQANPPSKLVVIKEVVTFWAYHIDFLKSHLGTGLRFIWLVRDVRGWVSSWTYVPEKQKSTYVSWKYSTLDFYDKYYSKCDSEQAKNELDLPQHILDTISKYRKFLQDKREMSHLRMAAVWTIETLVHHYMLNKYLPEQYHLIRYEDISANPLVETEKMFKFSGIFELPPETREFVIQSTSSGTEKNRWNTQRNATTMINIWQTRLTICQIKQIEEISKPAFMLMGYEPYSETPHQYCKLDLA